MPDFDIGDEVRIAEDAPSQFRPGCRAWFVSLPTANRNLVVIEFEDGSSIEVPPEVVRSRTEETGGRPVCRCSINREQRAYAPAVPDVHAHYLRDLGTQVRADALNVRRDQADGGEFERGQAFAYYRVLSLMQQQAGTFGLQLNEIGLDGLDPDRDLLSS